MLRLILQFATCKKPTPYIAITPGLKSGYAFNFGSYWIYKDSISGLTDSAYIYNSYDVNTKINGDHEELYFTIKLIDSIATHIEKWNTFLWSNYINVSFENNKDSTENYIYGERLIDFPLVVGDCIYVNSTIRRRIESIYNKYYLNGVVYTNVALVHFWIDTSINKNQKIVYNDYMYLCPNIGIIKMVFNHQKDSVHRVLELQKYKTLTY